MLFIYTAKSKNGEVFEDKMEMPDRFSVAREIRSRGNTPISISEENSNFSNLSTSFENLFSKVKVAEQIIFIKNLSGMLRAGLSIVRAISVLQKQTKNKMLYKILEGLSAEINSGGNLSSGLAKYPNVFSKLFVSMTKAGEESGNLAGALSEVGANLEKSNALTKKIKGALTYPAVILSAMVGIGILMFAFVVPTLAKTFNDLGAELPSSTKFIIFMGNFFSEHLILSFIIVIGFVFFMSYLFRAPFLAKYFDFMIIKLPMIGTMAKELNTARTARTMSSLLLSGVSITRSIDITKDVVQNIYYKRVLDESREEIEKGAPFSEAFEAHPELYPVMMSEMVKVGEETGKLSDMLLEVAHFYEEEIENKTKNLSTIIEPILMLIIGAGVGFFAVSMITPLYTVMDTIK